MAAVVTNKGLAKLVSAFLGAGGGALYIALGTSTTAAAATDTALGAEDTSLARVACTLTSATTNVTGDTIQATVTVNFTSNKTYAELGLFDAAASSSGNLIYHRDSLSLTVGPSNGVTQAVFNESIVL